MLAPDIAWWGAAPPPTAEIDIFIFIGKGYNRMILQG